MRKNNNNNDTRIYNLVNYGKVDELNYAGYLNVNKTTNSNLFYWFIEKENNIKEK